MSVCPVSSSVSTRNVVLIGLRLWLDRDGDDRIREGHRLEHDRGVVGRERVAGRRRLEADAGRDLAGHDLLPLLAVVRMHLQDAADALGAARGRVEDSVARLERAGVDAEVRQLADVRVGHDLEGQSRERRLWIGRPLLVAAVLRGDTVHRRHVERARQVVDDSVEQELDALVLEGGAEQHRRDLVGERAGPDGAADHLRRHRGLVFDVRGEHLVVEVRDRVDQLVVVLLRLLDELRRDLDDVELLAEVVAVDDGLHLDEVDDTREVVLRPDRDLERHRVRAEPVAHRLHGPEEVRAGAVHLVDERDARHLVLVRLPPDRLRLWLHARDGVEDCDRAVEDAQAALDLDRKVHVPGRIDDVHPIVAPERRRRSRRDRDPALLLLGHPVHRRGALVHLSHLVGAAGVVEDPLGRRRLARVDVGHDPDVPDAVERDGLLCHLRAQVFFPRSVYQR
jgi:hypothetical protein